MKLRSSLCADPGPRRAAGLTLIEVLVTLSIVALLMTLAVPSFKPILDRWRVKQSLGALTDTLRLARSEGIKRGGGVVLQKLPNNTNGCALAPTAADWGCGWRLFVDSDANGSYTPGEEILQTAQMPAGIEVKHVVSVAAIGIDRWGKMDGLNAKSFTIFPSPDGTASAATRTLCISAGGRIHDEEGPVCKG